MTEYRRKPEVIKAWKFEPGAVVPDWFFAKRENGELKAVIDITVEDKDGTDCGLDNGDWIVKGSDGFTLFEDRAFQADYEPDEPRPRLLPRGGF